MMIYRIALRFCANKPPAPISQSLIDKIDEVNVS